MARYRTTAARLKAAAPADSRPKEDCCSAPLPRAESGDAAAQIGIPMLPKNAFGGLIGVTGGTAAGTGVYGMPANGKYVCLGSIPGKAARAMDVAMDDGVANTGVMRSASGNANLAPVAGAPGAATYDDGLTYTVCTTL